MPDACSSCHATSRGSRPPCVPKSSSVTPEARLCGYVDESSPRRSAQPLQLDTDLGPSCTFSCVQYGVEMDVEPSWIISAHNLNGSLRPKSDLCPTDQSRKAPAQTTAVPRCFVDDSHPRPSPVLLLPPPFCFIPLCCVLCRMYIYIPPFVRRRRSLGTPRLTS